MSSEPTRPHPCRRRHPTSDASDLLSVDARANITSRPPTPKVPPLTPGSATDPASKQAGFPVTAEFAHPTPSRSSLALRPGSKRAANVPNPVSLNHAESDRARREKPHEYSDSASIVVNRRDPRTGLSRRRSRSSRVAPALRVGVATTTLLRPPRYRVCPMHREVSARTTR